MNEETSYLEIQLIQLYKTLHKIPEIGLKQYKTTAFILQYLSKIPQVQIVKPTVQTQLQTGLVAVLRAPSTQPSIKNGYLFRCDIDALNFKELSGVEYASQNGLHHACGHDAHTAIMLISIKKIAKRKQELKRDVYFVFQPGEQGHGGASKLLKKYPNLLDSIEHCFAIHVTNNKQKGFFGIPSGYVTANSNRFTIQIIGKSAHCMVPEVGIDANYIGCQIVNQIYSVKTRLISPTSGMAITVIKIEGGSNNASIPQYMKIIGTIRSIKPQDHHRVLEYIQKHIKGICDLNGAKYTFKVSQNLYRAVKNDSVAVKIMEKNAKKIFKQVLDQTPSFAGEDFCQFSEKKPSCYGILGSAIPGSIDAITQESIFPIHSNRFKLDEKTLWNGTQLWLNLALD